MIRGFDDKGNYLTPEEFLKYKVGIYDNHGGIMQRFFRGIATKTEVGTRLWMSLSDIKNKTLSLYTRHSDKQAESNLINKNKYVIVALIE